MSYHQYPNITFDLIHERHNQLLQEAAQQRLLNTINGSTTFTSTFWLWLRGRQPEQTIQDFELTLTSTMN